MGGSFAPPSSGFTFDQQSAPSSPVRGDTWRERADNRDVIQRWFSNGTYWLSEDRLTIDGTMNPSNQAFVFEQSPYNLFIEHYQVSALWNATNTFTGTAYDRFVINSATGANLFEIRWDNETVPSTTRSFKSITLNQHFATSVIQLLSPVYARVGTLPGAAFVAQWKILYRLARK